VSLAEGGHEAEHDLLLKQQRAQSGLVQTEQAGQFLRQQQQLAEALEEVAASREPSEPEQHTKSTWNTTYYTYFTREQRTHFSMLCEFHQMTRMQLK
jgi:hypothetical protein